MRKDTFWFEHDYNSRNDERILELRSVYGAEGYGVFWMIVESMAETSNGGVRCALIGGLSLGYGVPKERLKAIIDFSISVGLFYEENGSVFSKRLNKHKDTRKLFAQKGKEGAEKRWNNRGANGEGNAKDRTGQDITEQETPLPY